MKIAGIRQENPMPARVNPPIANHGRGKANPKVRATVASFESMFVHVGGALAMLIGGFLADFIGPRLTLVSTSVFILPAVVSYLTIHGRKPRIT